MALDHSLKLLQERLLWPAHAKASKQGLISFSGDVSRRLGEGPRMLHCLDAQFLETSLGKANRCQPVGLRGLDTDLPYAFALIKP